VKGKDDQVNGNDDRAHFEALEAAETADQAGLRQPWSRQPGESSKAFDAFVKYRDLNERRTMAKVATMLGCTAQNVERWAARWSWTARVYAFDAMEEARWREQAARDRIAHHRRQVQLGQAVQSIAVAGVRELQAKLEQKLPLGLTPIELATLLKLGDELESRGLGVSREGKYTRINVILRRQTDDPSPEEKPLTIDGQTPLKPNQ
jgi:hypothetical protein